MSSPWDAPDRPRRRHRHHRRRRSQPPEPATHEAEDALLTPEERALHEARRRAEGKAKLTGELIRFAIITGLLLLFVPPAGIAVLIFWGSGLGKRYYRLVFEPRLRERFMREEVERQVRAQLSEERQMLHGEHARSMQELSASIAHEIRNPITAAKSLVQQMEEDPQAKENVEYARVAMEELSRVERSVSHLLRFARDEEMRVAPVRMADVLDSALETFRDRIARTGVVLERRVDGEGLVEGDAEKLRRVVINLVGNAIDAASEGGRQGGRVEVLLGENLAGTEVWLRISDDGPGVDEQTLQKMFSPFYTSKESGTGLGLPICKKLVDAHGGQIEVENAPDGGAVFVVTLPKRRAEGGRS